MSSGRVETTREKRSPRRADLAIALVIGTITWGAGFAVAFVTVALVGLAEAARPVVVLVVVVGVPTLFSAHVLRRHREGNWSRAEQIAFLFGALAALCAALVLFAGSITPSRPPVV